MRKLEIVTWQEVRKQVALVNKELATIIDEINPNNHYKLVKATYLYGDLIVNRGLVQFPTAQSKLCSVHEIDLPKTIKESLASQPIPLFLTLKNDNEVFVNTGTRIIPLNLFHQGSLLGVFETVNFILQHKVIPKWCVSAGARSIFMLPRITDNLRLDRLRFRYDIPATIRLKYLQDHWEFFTAMTRHESFEQAWHNEVLFFTQQWISAESQSKWFKFKEYLHKQSWKQIQFSIGKVDHSLQWETFIESISVRNLKPRPYLADQVKHILSIATSQSPAFRPLKHLTETAPIQGIQNAFLDTYLLKEYLPTLMCIFPLNEVENGESCYYSLSFPTLLEGSPTDKSTATFMLDLKKIKLLIDTFNHYIKKHDLSENHFMHHIEIDYFHTDRDRRGEIQRKRSSNYIYLN